MNTNVKLINAGLILVLSLVFSPIVMAVEYATFHGSNCRATVATDASKIETSVIGIRNTSNAPVSVVCPLARDNPFNLNGTNLVRPYIFRSASATTAFSCTLNSRDNKGGLVSSNNQIFNGTGESSLNLDVNTSTAGGYYVVFCSVPGGFSGIRGIYVEEP